MGWSFDFGYALEENIGPEGLSREELSAPEGVLRDFFSRMEDARDEDEPAFLALPYDPGPARICAEWARGAGEDFDTMVLVGIGGSALGPRAIRDALCHPHHNMLPSEKRRGMRFFVCDNVDPSMLRAVLDVADPERTVFNVISKSGGTAEAMATYMVVHQMLKERVGATGMQNRIVLTTDPEKGELKRASIEEGFRAFEIPPGVGGRYSVLTPVGLLPAAAMGIEPERLLEGARWADELCRKTEPAENPAAMIAAISYLYHKRKKRNVLVMMPYRNGLLTFAEWFQQLWAESLGKRYDRDGNEVYSGSTPVRALGATDQHSQLQLYMEGPQDKLIVFIRVEEDANDVPIPEIYTDRDALSYLGGHSLGELLRAEQEATAAALAKEGRPSMTISLDRMDAQTLGALFFLFEIATFAAGELYKVNPFDQPGVELGKKLTYGMMGRKGYKREKTDPTHPWRLRQD